MHGFLNIDKPAGMTSHDVVARVRRLARQRRVGHAGTLDPAATGVLVVALGQATRLIEYVQEQTLKRYTATVRLGATTTTDDADGALLEQRTVPPLDRAAVEATLEQFRGTIQQVPPMYSALHHQGRRLYELAREGATVDLPARSVTIHTLALTELAPPLLVLDVLCGKGTYIRSLARDLGAAIGCGAHLQALRRTAVGTFTIDDALTLHELQQATSPERGAPADEAASGQTLAAALLAPEAAVLDWPLVALDHAAAGRVRNGQTLALELEGQRARAYGPDGVLLALLAGENGIWRPTKVFDWS